MPGAAPVTALANNGGSNPNAALSAGGVSSSNQSYVNPNAGFQATGQITPSPVPAPSTTMDAGAIQDSTTTPAFHFPSESPSVGTSAQNANSANTSIPTPQSIIQQESDPTPAEATNTTLLQKVAALIQGKTSLATNQTNAESAAGIPAMTKTVNDLSTQIQGLADQSTALQTAAGAGGSIENSEQDAATGRGITTGGLAPSNASDLRKNQIQQATIASQALTLKSAYYAANGNLTLAKDAADKSAQVQFDAEEQQINYMNSLIEANKPQMTKEEQAQADLVKAQLDDRTNAINNAKADKVTGVGLAATAMKNNPNDPTAQYAAQQVLAMNPDDPNYLNKVASLVGKYQTDPIATQQSLLDLQKTRLDIQVAQQNLNGGPANVLASVPPEQAAALKANGFSNYNTQTQSLAQQLATGQMAPADLSKRSTGESPYNNILTAANAYSLATTGKPFNIAQADRDYKFATNVQTQNTLNYLGSLVGTDDGNGNLAGGNLDQLISQSQALGNTKGQGSLPDINDAVQWAKLQTGNPQVAAYYTTMLEVSDQIAKVLQGGGTGSGTSDAKLAQAQALFQKGFTPDQVSAVAGSLKGLLANRASSMIGDNPYLSDYATQFGVNTGSKDSSTTTQAEPTNTAKGTTWTRSDGTYVSDGTQWVKQ